MKHIILMTGLLSALTFALTAAAPAAYAASPVAPAPVPAPIAPNNFGAYGETIKMAAQYLNGLGTLKARFLLTAADGSQQIGTFYLNRPGKLRFEYDPPAKDFIVADGLLIYFYDAELKQQSNAPIGQTLADFLLRKNITLKDDVTVDRVMQGGGLLQITLHQTDDPGAGSLTLGFTEKPFQLKKWRVVDPQNQIVEVELFQVETGLKLDSNLFQYRDPNPKKRLND